MDAQTVFLALGLALILEGLAPFVVPQLWRQAVQHLLELADGQIRFFGMAVVLAGLALVWAAAW